MGGEGRKGISPDGFVVLLGDSPSGVPTLADERGREKGVQRLCPQQVEWVHEAFLRLHHVHPHLQVCPHGRGGKEKTSEVHHNISYTE